VPEPALSVEQLVVRYGELVAVDGVSWTAAAGEVTAVIGPNGAGKTTTIEVCEGFREITSGRVRVLGMNPAVDQQRLAARMGVMLQDGGVYPSARAADVVRLFCALHGGRAEPGALLERVGLTDRATATWRRMSGGERQRLCLALALAAQPDIAFLDEPTSGVDVNGRATIRELVAELAGRGCCVVLATHELDEAEKMADRVVVLDHGKVLPMGRSTRSAVRAARSAFASPRRSTSRRSGSPSCRRATRMSSRVRTTQRWPASRRSSPNGTWKPIDLRAGSPTLEDTSAA
jgi:ABC-2 type transport system ATP-binding protein